MTDAPDRPDPDALLRMVQEEEAREKQGKLRIFFGFAPGVGKTFRMLQVARSLLDERRVDLVVGLVETHRRPETAALLDGLELLPRRAVAYRGRSLEEFDLDAALARKPAILLVDELAHTNAPGSRHAKRWQDVLELLDAGIDVFTTVNVQHVESLNDVVAQITRVQVRETIPDSILDRADAIELVDIAPEELLKRLSEGKVYLPEQALRAADHFFQRGKLLALRELALRRTAQQVDEEVQEYREQHGVAATWPAGERVLVCVGPAPSSARLVRAAARIAAGLRCPWVAVYAEPASALSAADQEHLDGHLRLAESLGATVARLAEGSIAEAILRYARRHNVTRIVIGKPTHSRLRDRLSGSLLDAIVRGSGEIDVQVIAGDAPGERAPRQRSPGQVARMSYLLAVGLTLLTTAIAAGIQWAYPLPDIEVLYLLSVMIAAFRWGRGPSILCAALGVAAYDFFFVPPFLTFAVSDARYFLTFAMMFGVGFVVSELTSRLRRQERHARAREERTAALYALSRDLAHAETLREIAAILAGHAANTSMAQAVVLGAGEEQLEVLAAVPEKHAFDDKEMTVARWCFEHGRVAGVGTDTLPGSRSLCLPFGVGDAPVGVLALAPSDGAPFRMDQREFLDTLCRQAAFAFERARLFDAARVAALRTRTEEMRSTLLSAVSHDLRTPLAAITGSATLLRDGVNLEEPLRAELIGAICDEAERLERLVANLLDMTRLDSGALSLVRDWVPLEEMIGSALGRVEARLGARPVRVELAPALPLLWVDPVLFEQVFINLFENVAKYTPSESPLEVQARVEEDQVVIAVCDRGPGLPAGGEERIFERFYRGVHVGVGGAGLGLPICRGIVEAHGGTLLAENRAGGGAVFRVKLPVVGESPAVSLQEPPP